MIGSTTRKPSPWQLESSATEFCANIEKFRFTALISQFGKTPRPRAKVELLNCKWAGVSREAAK